MTSDTPETNKFRASLDGMREINQRDRLLSHSRKLEIERDKWKARFTDAVERLEGKLHCVEGCKCSGRREVNMLREILQGNADASPPSERKNNAQ
jgi:phage antirepressor YoqD-like protein